MYNETQIGSRLASIFNLTGKVAVITGAAQGLGREMVRLFAEVGAQVVIADLNVEAAKLTAADIEAKGGTAAAFGVNVAEALSVEALFAAIDSRFGPVDILVNNAAYRGKAEFFDMSVEQWDAMQQVTLRGSFLCAREAIRRMRARGRGGSIVNISSVSAVHPTLWGVNAHYDAAKAGLDALTRSLASEFASDGIRVNSLLPGGMNSEGGRNISGSYEIRGPMIGAGRVALGRMADPMEVAQVALFLASPAASYVTGQLLAADGGYMVS
jgi:NAD(P)-dependent dehydrogenase (short-subunit alcohol dehydrogenase family)